MSTNVLIEIAGQMCVRLSVRVCAYGPLRLAELFRYPPSPSIEDFKLI